MVTRVALLLLLGACTATPDDADSGSSDGGATDGGASDGGASDGGSGDGGASDGGTSDGGTSDGGSSDGGSGDGGSSDGGSSDGGSGDGGATDSDEDGSPAGEDCDDDDATRYPGATEVCGDGVVNDCDATEADANAACLVPGERAWSDADVTITGDQAGGNFGRGMLGGDFTGDGQDDLLVTSPGTGAARVFAGPVVTGTTASDAAAVIDIGATADELGNGLAAFDGGVWLGAPEATISNADQGAAWLFATPLSGSLDGSDADAVVVGGIGDLAGWGLDAADADGDGTADLVLGAPGDASSAGVALLFVGPHSGSLALGDADLRVEGDAAGDLAGNKIVIDDDLSGDGQPDIVVAAPMAASIAGIGAVFSGDAAGTQAITDGDALIYGEVDGDEAANGMCAPGDVDGDGYRDLWVGSNEHAVGSGVGVGNIALVSGPITGVVDLGDSTVQIEGTGTDDHFGWIFTCDADIDGDGRNDLMAAAPADDHAAGTNAGSAGLFLAPYAGTTDLDLADVVVRGASTGSVAGRDAIFAGDLDGDGWQDIAVGSLSSGGGLGAATVWTGLTGGF